VSAAILTQGLRKVYPAPSSRGRRDGFQAGRGPGGASGPPFRPPPAPSASGDRDSTGIVALAGLDLEIRDGEFFGLLGPNGAGKTTTIGILTTRVRATAGRGLVAGADVSTDSVAVRQRIGVVPQRPNPDRGLSVLDNLVFHAAYFGIPRSRAVAQAHALLEQFEIGQRAESKVDELSGGQQQRLMIARALIHEPRVIFLDEPTVGLDPQARRSLWDILRDLHAQGRTIVMTTHYMEEADRLCERVAIVDEGRLLAIDTPAALRARAPGGTLVELTLDGDAAPSAALVQTLAHVTGVSARDGVLRVYSDRGGQIIPALIDTVQSSGRTVNNINLAAPSLETLFLSLTGKRLD
jgi:ABC-2 type transport system ATP-binding protein